MNNMVSRLRFLSKKIIQKQKILFTFHKIRFTGHLILESSVQLCPICLEEKNANCIQPDEIAYGHGRPLKLSKP